MIRSGPGVARSVPAWLGLTMVISMMMTPALPAAAEPSAPPWDEPWTMDLRADHPLAGRAVDAGTGDPLDVEAVSERLARARFVLLGETHDNPDAHRAQAWLLSRMIEAGRRPAVVMEMLDSTQSDALADYLASGDATAAGLGPAVAWAETGWPDWAMYQPIAAEALAAGLPILTGNLPTETVRRIAMEGTAPVLGDDGLAPRALDEPLPEEMREVLAREIMTSHCDMLPDKAIPGMIAAQRARDGEMARAMLDGAGLPATDGAVLIAGNGHIRRDRAVPWYLDRLVPESSVVSVAVMEVPPGLPADPVPADLRDTDATVGPTPFDLIVFVPAVDDEDPCEKFRRQLEHLRDRHEDNAE